MASHMHTGRLMKTIDVSPSSVARESFTKLDVELAAVTGGTGGAPQGNAPASQPTTTGGTKPHVEWVPFGGGLQAVVVP